ncbi:helix-turn-helix transcriptional regulator [Streptomyces tateyamensis]|nr:helix-turn-helix transcriptional regulator [Streptomyces tateyamensis]
MTGTQRHGQRGDEPQHGQRRDEPRHGDEHQHQQRRTALANFLRSRRARLSPQDVGLPAGGRRRTPGLRREELAVLAGVGVTWYTWLEQGREINPSPEVLAALAGTLRLDPAETDYFFRLAGSQPGPHPDRPVRGIPAALNRLLAAQAPSPAYLLDADWDVRAWNPQAEALLNFSQYDPVDRNMAWLVFANPLSRARTVDWEYHARRTLAQLRASYAERGGAETPGGRQLAALIARLRGAFPEADAWLDEHEVQERAGTAKDLLHERLGPLCLDQIVLRAPEDLQLVILQARDEATAARLPHLTDSGDEQVVAVSSTFAQITGVREAPGVRSPRGDGDDRSALDRPPARRGRPPARRG